MKQKQSWVWNYQELINGFLDSDSSCFPEFLIQKPQTS